jgi:seryl-tRNA synthetase
MSEDNQKLSVTPNNQNFACLSFFEGKDDNGKNLTYIRVGGVFDTLEKASEHAKNINSVDNAHNVFVGEMGRWLPFDTSSSGNYVEEVEYANDQLNELMKGYRENQEKSKLFHEHRKNEKMMENINDNIKNQEKNKEEITKKISKAKSIDEVKTLTASLDNIDEQMKRFEERLKELNETQSKLTEKLGSEVSNTTE